MQHEIDFWKHFVTTNRFLDGWLSSSKTPELNDIVYGFLLNHRSSSVLDVGSGVVSLLHGTIDSDKLVACDPLADEYAKFFNYNGHRVNQPIAKSAESLDLNTKFNIVHISNALDHCQDVQKAYSNLYACVDVNGYLILQSFANEGSYENYEGFHQWNLNTIDNQLILTNKYADTWVLDKDPYFVTKIFIPSLHKEWFIWIKKK